MRAACLVVCCLLFFAVSAGAESIRPECRQLEKKIERMTATAQRMDARGNDAFVERAEMHIDRFNDLRHRLGCPETVAESTMRTINYILKLAASGAITFFTMGMAPTPL